MGTQQTNGLSAAIDARRNATPRSPWTVDDSGRTAAVVGDAKVRQFLETFLFTVPAERVNRPTYGAGTMHLLFHGATQVEQTLRQRIQGDLTQEMMDLIDIQGVDSTVVGSIVRLTVHYRLRTPTDTAQQQAVFERPIAS